MCLQFQTNITGSCHFLYLLLPSSKVRNSAHIIFNINTHLLKSGIHGKQFQNWYYYCKTQTHQLEFIFVYSFGRHDLYTVEYKKCSIKCTIWWVLTNAYSHVSILLPIYRTFPSPCSLSISPHPKQIDPK